MSKLKELNQNREVSYCNTCVDFPLDKCVDHPKGWAACGVRKQLYAWDSPACMFFRPVGEVERTRRKPIAVTLYKRGKEPASAEAKDAPEAGK